jgi:hypothetical protein
MYSLIQFAQQVGWNQDLLGMKGINEFLLRQAAAARRSIRQLMRSPEEAAPRQMQSRMTL